MLATKVKRVKMGYKVSKVNAVRKENWAIMGQLVRKENQDQRGQLDHQEGLFRRVQREKRGIKGSVEYLERGDQKESAGNLGLPVFQVAWGFQV